jgi:hypothetical protein
MTAGVVPFLNHGRRGIAFRQNSSRIVHKAFEAGLGRIGAQRRKTAVGSPKGERSESINRIFRITGIGLKAFDLA